jgi:hypothetical protein
MINNNNLLTAENGAMDRLDANPDLDTTFHFDADPDPDPTRSFPYDGTKSVIYF